MHNNLLIEELRIKNGYTQEYIANKLKVSLRCYQNYEYGLYEMNLDKLNILSNLYKVSLNGLLGLTSNLISYNTKERINYKMLARYLKYIRMTYNYTQRQMANMFDVSINSVSKYESKTRFVSLEYLYKFAKKFGVSVDYICSKTSKKEVL